MILCRLERYLHKFIGCKIGRLPLYEWSVNFSYRLQKNKYLSFLEPWTKRLCDMMSYKLLVFLMQILQIHPMSLFVSYTSLGKGQCLLFLKKSYRVIQVRVSSGRFVLLSPLLLFMSVQSPIIIWWLFDNGDRSITFQSKLWRLLIDRDVSRSHEWKLKTHQDT